MRRRVGGRQRRGRCCDKGGHDTDANDPLVEQASALLVTPRLTDAGKPVVYDDGRDEVNCVTATILNIAHRGASSVAPENTFAAFEAAIAADASAVEMDLRATSDGRVVVIHDESVDRTTDGTGAVEQLTLEEIGRLDAGGWFSERFAGERVPLLEEVIERLPRRVPLVLHIKEAGRGVEQAVVRAVTAEGVEDQVTVSSSHRRVLAATRTLAPRIRTTWIAWFPAWHWWMWYIAGRVRRIEAERVAAKGSLVSSGMVRYFHDRNIAVRAWGVDRDEPLAARLIDMGVDGMTFDDPTRLWEMWRDSVKETTGGD